MSLVGQERHLDPRGTVQENGPSERLPAVAVADLVHRGVERPTRPRVEWEG